MREIVSEVQFRETVNESETAGFFIIFVSEEGSVISKQMEAAFLFENFP